MGDVMHMSRERAAELARDTMRILKAGRYTTESGHEVEIADGVRRAVESTLSYPPHKPLPSIVPGMRESLIEVANESTLAAARRLVEAGERPAALNFASAKNPGGGFLTGARAQEESLCRSSALYACLADSPMYEFHRSRTDPSYSNYAIYSPDVPVFRTDEGTLLSEPYLCSFLTSPAANAKEVLRRDRSRRAELRKAMQDRVQKVLTVAAAHGHDSLVLGAWGCGVFGNDPREVADLFRRALAEDFRGKFAHIVFAVLDWSEDRHIIGPFQGAFGPAQD